MNKVVFLYASGLLVMASIVPHIVCGQRSKKTESTEEEVVCLKTERSILFRPKPRRYDVDDMGWDIEIHFHGWADVQGQGAANDYCRIVGLPDSKFLSCELAGSDGSKKYNSAEVGFDLGYRNTWYMKDEDGDGRDDYCRCVTKNDVDLVVCTRAGPNGFYGSVAHGNNTDINFSPTGPLNCRSRAVFPEFGKPVPAP